jgi:hypothetical protein
MKDKYLFEELYFVAESLKEWIDAVPKDTVLPCMPGVDRDFVNEILERSKNSIIQERKEFVRRT